MVNNLPANAGDMGLIPGSEDPLEQEMASHSSIFSWRIPWTVGLAGYSPWGCRELDMTEMTENYPELIKIKNLQINKLYQIPSRSLKTIPMQKIMANMYPVLKS